MNKKPILLILAAGSSTRFGSLKQTAIIGDKGETIMDYSIYDAVRAGFGKVVFVIRKTFYETFIRDIASKWSAVVEIAYVFQELDSYVLKTIEGREKPWGTGHAFLCAKEKIDAPFCVINADDLYGSTSFQLMHHFLTTSTIERENAMVAFEMKATLSENGAVSRGVCTVSADGFLESVVENTGIFYSKELQKIVSKTDQVEVEIEEDTLVSMNFWGFKPSVFKDSQLLFDQFITNNPTETEEFYLPSISNHLIEQKKCEIKVMKSNEKWFGVTFAQDQQTVIHEIDNCIKKGIYPQEPWKESLIQY